MFDLKLLEMGYTSVLKWACDQGPSLERSNRFHWTIVGEWTCEYPLSEFGHHEQELRVVAHTDCAKWLNGRGRGARWDNTLTSVAPYAPILFRNQSKADEKISIPREL